MRKVHRLSSTIKVEKVSPGSTVGKMRHHRKVSAAGVIDFFDVIGVGRFTLPVPSTRRI